MKAKLKKNALVEEINLTNLLIEAGREGMSMIAYNAADAASIVDYQFKKNAGDAQIVEELKNIFKTDSLLLKTYPTVNICWNFVNSNLVPTTYYNKTFHKDYCELNGMEKNDFIRSDYIGQHSIYNVYSVPEKINTAFAEQFPMARNVHSTSLQLQQNYGDGWHIECIIYLNKIKLLLFKNNDPLFVNYFDYTTALDAVYYLLNICTQHGFNPGDTKLVLSGSIESKSNFYHELYRYFLNINFKQLPNGFTSDSFQSSYPTHFFSHLIALTKCV